MSCSPGLFGFIASSLLFLFVRTPPWRSYSTAWYTFRLLLHCLHLIRRSNDSQRSSLSIVSLLFPRKGGCCDHQVLCCVHIIFSIPLALEALGNFPGFSAFACASFLLFQMPVRQLPDTVLCTFRLLHSCGGFPRYFPVFFVRCSKAAWAICK